MENLLKGLAIIILSLGMFTIGVAVGNAIGTDTLTLKEINYVAPIEPSYEQGFYDGFNTTTVYFNNTEQFKDSVYIDMFDIIEKESEYYAQRKSELIKK